MNFEKEQKLKFKARVEFMDKMDLPLTDHGYYVILELNGNYVASWKLNKFDESLVIPKTHNRELYKYLTDAEFRNEVLEVNEDGLDGFVATKFSKLFNMVDDFERGIS